MLFVSKRYLCCGWLLDVSNILFFLFPCWLLVFAAAAAERKLSVVSLSITGGFFAPEFLCAISVSPHAFFTLVLILIK